MKETSSESQAVNSNTNNVDGNGHRVLQGDGSFGIFGDRNIVSNKTINIGRSYSTNNIFLIALFCLFFLITVGFAQINKEDRPKKIEMQVNHIYSSYKDYNNSFIVKHPNNWIRQEIQNPITHEIVSFTPVSEIKIGKAAEAEIIISVEKLDKPITISSYMDSLKSQLKLTKNFQSFKIIEQGKTMFGQSPAYGLIYTVDIDGSNWKITEMATVRNLQVYLITYKAKTLHYSKYKKDADEIINSFSINQLN